MDFDNSLDIISPDGASNTLTIGGTGSLQVPSGTTAQRPGSSLSVGMLRWSTDTSSGGITGALEIYTGATNTWKQLQYQSLNLDGLSALATTGLVSRTGSGTYSPRTITVNTSRLQITNGDGVSGNPSIDLATNVTLAGALNEAPMTTLASAGTIDIGAQASNTISVTGTTTITSLGTTATSGMVRRLIFSGALTLTHNSSTLILPGGANITTATNDSGSFTYNGTGWICTSYTKANGQAIVAASSLSVLDEGSSITSAATSLNFTGTSITATNASGAVTINVTDPASPSTVTSSTTGQFTLRTTTGNQNITGLGFQPKAVIFWYTEVVNVSGSASGLQNQVRRTFGAATSSTQRWCFESSADQLDHDADQQFISTYCFFLRDANTGTIQIAADFVRFNYDGFTLNVLTTNGSAHAINYLAIGGDGLNAYAGTWIQSGTGATGAASAGANQSINAVGFRPTCTIFASASTFNNTESESGSNDVNVGFAVSSSKQASLAYYFNSSASPALIYDAQRTDCCLMQISGSGFNDRMAFVSNDTSGFTVNWNAHNGSFDYKIGYLCLGGGIQADVVTITEPGSTGSQAITGLAFKPACEFFMTNCRVAGTTVIAGSKVAWGAATSSSLRATGSWNTPSGTASASYPVGTASTSAALVVPGTTNSSTVASVDLTSQDTAGFTLNWSQVDGVGSQVVALVIGDTSQTTIYTGQNINSFKATVGGTSLSANDLVYLDSSGLAQKADATTEGKEAIGFVKSAYSSSSTAVIYYAGNIMTGLTGLTPGSAYYLNTTAGGMIISGSAPSTVGSGNVLQKVGVALSSTTLLFSPDTPITL